MDNILSPKGFNMIVQGNALGRGKDKNIIRPVRPS
jgi:hypothetical protein